MKWIRRLGLVLLLLLLALGAALYFTALRSERPVGFEITQTQDDDGKPMPVGIWYPTEARPWPTTFLGPMLMEVARGAPLAGQGLPLVLISHGNGAGIPSHADLAMALASAGHVVAVPMHPGDNFADPSASGSATLFSGRNRQLRLTLDHVLKSWLGGTQIDPQRIGAFGFSAGGFTVLTAVGAKPDLRQLPGHCASADEFVCKVLKHYKSPLLDAAKVGAGTEFAGDPRIRAAVVAAPGLGFTLSAVGLAPVRVPVQLWSGDRDDKVPYASNAKFVREGLGERVDFRNVEGAGHFAFLAPCTLLKGPEFCQDPDQFDRPAFHARMNAEVVAFMARHLRAP